MPNGLSTKEQDDAFKQQADRICDRLFRSKLIKFKQYHNMQIKCEERYHEAIKHAEQTNDKTLQDCLQRLQNWETRENAEIHLMKDRSPLSLYFEMYNKTGDLIMNGGVVYHGNPDQSYSFTTDPTIGWQIQT